MPAENVDGEGEHGRSSLRMGKEQHLVFFPLLFKALSTTECIGFFFFFIFLSFSSVPFIISYFVNPKRLTEYYRCVSFVANEINGKDPPLSGWKG